MLTVNVETMGRAAEQIAVRGIQVTIFEFFTFFWFNKNIYFIYKKIKN